MTKDPFNNGQPLDPLDNLHPRPNISSGESALRTIAEFPVTDEATNMDAVNMRRIAQDGLAALATQPAPAEQAFQKALEIRMSQGWQLGGNACPVLYTDTINGEQVMRDDLWLATTAGLKGAPAPAEVVAWTPGPNVFKDWCSQWFGPDSDDDYLARAVFDLPPMAQRFRHPAPVGDAPSVPTAGITIDFKQATELLEMFGGEPTEITLMAGEGHSGEGLYAVYNADPEGAVYLGKTDEDAAPSAPTDPKSAAGSDLDRLCRFRLSSKLGLTCKDDNGPFVRYDDVRKVLSATMSATASALPRFPNVSCSQCGQDFGPGNEGFSHCSDHAKAKPFYAELADEQITEIATVEHAAGRLAWSGFKKDDSGAYRIPVIEGIHCNLVRAVVASLAAPSAPASAAPSSLSAEDIDKKVREVYIGEGPRGLMLLCKRLMGASVQPVQASLSDGLQKVAVRREVEERCMKEADRDGRFLNAQGHQQAISAIDFCVAALASSTPTNPTKAE
ncbi:hypothetical protein [Variovorax sp. N23]|uniref:hypothetical protein n=1 Tax=Variovorax sp. N23 TaxID=2980555 RepID=UPI0021C78854|nr:hypothetical protein [Variovorax sp. N23]MCU4119356.1 hypothetical protein [Variovorax sp. N23]